MVELIIAWCIGSYQAGIAVCADATRNVHPLTEFQCAIVGQRIVAEWSEHNPNAVVQRWTCRYREIPQYTLKGPTND